MFFFASSRVSLETFETLLENRAPIRYRFTDFHDFSFLYDNTRFSEKFHHMSHSVTREFVEFEQFVGFHFRCPCSYDFNQGFNMFSLDTMKTFHPFKDQINR